MTAIRGEVGAEMGEWEEGCRVFLVISSQHENLE
jgi:hypothetical protein